ncbi:MAG: hypothetical protein WDZ84_02790 [Rhodovibrionaceae bacterium]
MNAKPFPETPDGLVAFAGPQRPILLGGAAALLDDLAVCLPDWRAMPADSGRADIAVEAVPRGYRVHCALFAEGSVESNRPLYAAGAISGALTSLYAAQTEELLLLHAAATATPAGLLIFLGDSMAGKSTLALQLACQGQRIFADDRLALRPQDGGAIEGLSLGVAPKTRLPLPPGSGAAYAAFIETHCVARNPGMAHLYLPPAIKAPLGETAPARALIAIDRQDTPAPAVLEELSASQILRDTLPKCLPSELTSETLLARTSALARALPGYRLRFSDSGAAASLIRSRFT